MTEAQALADEIKRTAVHYASSAAVGEPTFDIAVGMEKLIDRLAAMAQPAEPTLSQKMAAAGFTLRPSLWAMQAREALELIATPQRPDGSWNRDREACRRLAAEALGLES